MQFIRPTLNHDVRSQMSKILMQFLEHPAAEKDKSNSGTLQFPDLNGIQAEQTQYRRRHRDMLWAVRAVQYKPRSKYGGVWVDH